MIVAPIGEAAFRMLRQGIDHHFKCIRNCHVIVIKYPYEVASRVPEREIQSARLSTVCFVDGPNAGAVRLQDFARFID
jgi:hypothetical protein